MYKRYHPDCHQLNLYQMIFLKELNLIGMVSTKGTLNMHTGFMPNIMFYERLYLTDKDCNSDDIRGM